MSEEDYIGICDCPGCLVCRSPTEVPVDEHDAFPVDNGTCLVIGDVAGHGLRSAAVMAQLRNATRAFADRVVPLLRRGSVRPVVDRVFALEDVRAAEERLEANLGFGKVVLRVG